MAKIPKKMRWIYDLLLTAAILAMATVLCTLLRRIDDGSGYVNLIFVLAVATISRWTEGYFWGIFSAVSGVLFVNYVFTYPYWEFNFTITGYPFTFLAMLTVSMMISAMNTQIKKQERLRIETEKEAVRANLLRAMSHDIRTPLTSIVGNTAAILENEDSFSPEQKRRLLEDVNEDAQWLIRVVENLLSITRMGDTTTRLVKNPEPAEEILGAVTAKFRKRYPDVKLYVGRKDYGRIPSLARNAYERYIHRLLRENDLYDHVVFTGSLNAQQMKERYLKSQVFVLPSSIENSPNSLGEAMLLGVPCIASDVGGVRCLMTHGVEGLIYPADDPHLLAYDICEMFAHPEKAAQMARAGREHAGKTHDAQKNLEILHQIYTEIAR